MALTLRLRRAEMERLRRATQARGFAALPNAVGPDLLRRLQGEARKNRSQAERTVQSAEVCYRAWIAPLGHHARTLLGGDSLSRLLLRTFGRRYRLSENRSCLTCYEEGDRLGLHRDEPGSECAVTVIVHVSVDRTHRRAGRTGLELRIYGRTMRPTPQPRLVLPTRTGDLVIGRGSAFWHERPALAKGEQLLALTACYQPHGATP